jgi:high-affinity iron transporter
MKRFLLIALGALLSASVVSAEEPAKAPAQKLPTPPTLTPEMEKKADAAFKLYCATCHGETGAGDGPAAVALNPKPRNFTKDPFRQGSSVAEVFLTLQTGVPKTTMVAFAHLPEEDRWGLAYKVNAMVPKKKPAKK